MDVIPQATPLYATDPDVDCVYLVVGWARKDTEPYIYEVTESDRQIDWVPLGAPLGGESELYELFSTSTLHPTLQAAQEALLNRD